MPGLAPLTRDFNLNVIDDSLDRGTGFPHTNDDMLHFGELPKDTICDFRSKPLEQQKLVAYDNAPDTIIDTLVIDRFFEMIALCTPRQIAV